MQHILVFKCLIESLSLAESFLFTESYSLMESTSTYIDRELILMASAGDTDAFREVFDKYHNKIYSIAWKITGAKTVAEDVVQDVFIKLWVHREKLAVVENFNAYLNAIVRNHIFNSLRKIANEQTLLRNLCAQIPESNKGVFDSVCCHELEELVHKAVCELTPQQKRIYNFSRLDGLKHQEIAEKMGISRSTVKGHITAALSHIKAVILSNNELVILLILINAISFF